MVTNSTCLDWLNALGIHCRIKKMLPRSAGCEMRVLKHRSVSFLNSRMVSTYAGMYAAKAIGSICGVMSVPYHS